jgi:hypothetical protein
MSSWPWSGGDCEPGTGGVPAHSTRMPSRPEPPREGDQSRVAVRAVGGEEGFLWRAEERIKRTIGLSGVLTVRGTIRSCSHAPSSTAIWWILISLPDL